MKSSVMIGGESDVYKRHDSDLYPTPKECTYALADFILENKLLDKEELIWECACGHGAIMDALEANGFENQIGTDLSLGIDFLSREKHSDVVITNPPFNLGAEFIKRALELDLKFFAFLLKGQFWHSKNRLPLFNLQKPSYILPLTWRPVFVPERGKQPTMEFMWCIWIKGDEQTKYIPLKKP